MDKTCCPLFFKTSNRTSINCHILVQNSTYFEPILGISVEIHINGGGVSNQFLPSHHSNEKHTNPVYVEPLESEHDIYSKLGKLVTETLTSWNHQDTGNIVILYLKSSTPENIIQVAQISRLFITHYVKYTSTAEEYAEKLQETYFITSDVDLLPLSAKYYHQNSYDWNLVNIMRSHSEDNEIDIALSSVGALARTWYQTIPEKKYGVEFYNDTGLRKMTAFERKAEIGKKGEKVLKGMPSKANIPNVDWCLDQTLISIWIEEYAKEFGWDSISPKKQEFYKLRVNREHNGDAGVWDDQVDLQVHSEPWKDSHFCQEAYMTRCQIQVSKL